MKKYFQGEKDAFWFRFKVRLSICALSFFLLLLAYRHHEVQWFLLIAALIPAYIITISAGFLKYQDDSNYISLSEEEILIRADFSSKPIKVPFSQIDNARLVKNAKHLIIFRKKKQPITIEKKLFSKADDFLDFIEIVSSKLEVEEQKKSNLWQYPITNLLVVSIISVYLFSSDADIQNRIINHYAFYPQRLSFGNLYTLVTYFFLHLNFTHLVVNITFYIVTLPHLEKVLKPLNVIFILLISTILGSILFYLFSEYDFVIGSSAGAFGVIGANLYLKIFEPSSTDVWSRYISVRLFFLVVIFELLIPIVVPGLSFFAHLGGFVGGFICLYILKRKMINL